MADIDSLLSSIQPGSITPADTTEQAQPEGSTSIDDFLAGYKPEADAAPAAAPSDSFGSQFKRGLSNYLPGIKQTGNALETMVGVGAKKLGFDELGDKMIQSGIAGINAAKSQEKNDESDDLSTAWDKGEVVKKWLPYHLGALTGNLGELAAVAGASGVAGTAVGGPEVGAASLVGGMVMRNFAKTGILDMAKAIGEKYGADAATQFLAKQSGKFVGTTVGMAAQAGVHGFGDTGAAVINQADKDGTDINNVDIGKFLASSAGNTILNFMGEKVTGGNLWGHEAYKAAGDGAISAAKTIAGNAAVGAAKMVPVMEGQTALTRYASGQPLTGSDANKAYINAGADATMFGGVTGSYAGARRAMAGDAAESDATVPPGGAAPVTDETGAPITPPPAGANPVGDAANQADSPLSRAAVAGNPHLAVGDGMTQQAQAVEGLVRANGLMSKIPPDMAQNLIAHLQAAKNPNFPQAIRQASLDQLNNALELAHQQGLLQAPADAQAEQAGQPPSEPPAAPPAAPPEDPNLKTVQVYSEGQPDTTPAPQAGVPASGDVADAGVAPAAEAPATAAEDSAPKPRTSATAPVVAIPAGDGTAQIRKRRTQLDAMRAAGFDSVEQRDGKFFLVNEKTNQEMQLDGPLDAQLARKGIDDYVNGNATVAAKNPTEGQIEAGNYKKGHLELHGVPLAVENPLGTTRSGVGPDGNPWSSTMTAHYGYAKSTKSSDGEGVDVFIGKHPSSNKVWVIDQVNKDGSFDEPKAVMGARNEEEARQTYLSNYEPGWTGLGDITEMTVPEFKAWANSDAAKAPAKGYDPKLVRETQNGKLPQRDQPVADGAAGAQDTGSNDLPGEAGGADRGRVRDTVDPVAVRSRAAEPAVTDDDQAIADFQSRHKDSKIEKADSSDANTVGTNALLSILHALTGHKGIAVKWTGDGAPDGAFDPRTGRYFVNVDRPHQAIAWTIGHEFAHLAETMPGIKALYDKIWSLIPESARDQYSKDYLNKGRVFSQLDATEKAKLQQEMVADFFGKRFNDKAWLSDLAKKSPSTFHKFVNDWVQLLDHIVTHLKGMLGIYKGGSSRAKDIDSLMAGHIAELEQAKQIALEVAGEWIKNNPRLADKLNGDIKFSAREIEPSDDDPEMQRKLQEEFERLRYAHDGYGGDITQDAIRDKGLMAEDAYKRLSWTTGLGSRGSIMHARVVDPEKGNALTNATIERQDDGLWYMSYPHTWIAPIGASRNGNASLKMVQDFARRQSAATDLRNRGFDLNSTVTPEQRRALVNGWKAISDTPNAQLYDDPGRTDTSIKDIANSIGIGDKYDIQTKRDNVDPQHPSTEISLFSKATGERTDAIMDEHIVGGKKWLTINTMGMGKGGLGSAVYQLVAEYANRRNMQLLPESSLSGMNTYRRTEQQLSAALRTGKSNVMAAHYLQRIHGFDNNAKTIEQHDANLSRLALAGVRNAREQVQFFDKLTYNPETGKFGGLDYGDTETRVRDLLAETDARAMGLGRSTLARAVMSRMMLDGEKSRYH